MKRILSAIALFAFAVSSVPAENQTVRLSDLDVKLMSSGWGVAVPNKSIVTNALKMGGRAYEHGIGTHAESSWFLSLDGKAVEFTAEVGLDDGVKPTQPGSVEFVVYTNDAEAWRSGVMKAGQPPKPVKVPLAGVTLLQLEVTDAGNGKDFDHADWALASIVTAGDKPRAIAEPPQPVEEWTILTPPAPKAPRINGPKIYGARPGHPFLYRIPATGDRPMQFAADGLPAGLSLDAARGVLTGTTPAAGEYRITFRATNAHGQSERPFKLVAGDTLSLTPQMGWNHWYTHYNRITDEVMRQAADVMISSGMADHGYEYVNIDDCWMNAPATGKYQPDPKRVGPVRDEKGNIVPNAYFPDMKGLADYIHSKGLKAGLYTSPGPRTCAGFGGAYEHEAQDAKQFADWGFDFLKYDWCSYGGVVKGDRSLETLKKPYKLMGDLLKQQNRDIVLNLCQYGMGEVWKWGGEVGGHSWRTTGDLGLEKGSRLPGFYRIGMFTATLTDFAGPGRWNDPDYILIGWYGNAHNLGEPQKAKLTPNETYSYMSMWSLIAAPLFFSGDMSKLDEFTLNVLCNHEVIDVNQDVLGKAARVVRKSDSEFVLAKPLEDGSLAVGLFNIGQRSKKVKIDWADLNIAGPHVVRDLWRQRDIGVRPASFEVEVARHGVSMVRLSKAP